MNHIFSIFLQWIEGRNADPLKGFKLIGFGDNNLVLFNYTDVSIYNVSIYNVISDGYHGIRSVKITSQHTDNYLTLCEVEVYGGTPNYHTFLI